MMAGSWSENSAGKGDFYIPSMGTTELAGYPGYNGAGGHFVAGNLGQPSDV